MALPVLADLQSYLNRTVGADAELQTYLDAAITHVEARCGSLTAHTNVVSVKSAGGTTLVLPETRVSNVTAVTDPGLQVVPLVDVTVYSQAGLLGVPVGYAGTWTVAATYGVAVPADLRLAILIIAGHLWETQRVTTPGGPPGFAPGEAPVGASPGYAIPNRAADLMRPYIIPNIT